MKEPPHISQLRALAGAVMIHSCIFFLRYLVNLIQELQCVSFQFPVKKKTLFPEFA